MTPMPTTSTPTPVHAYTAIARRHKDGSVLLSIADDRICKLNGVGALMWMILEESPTGLSVDEVVRKLSEQFEAINSEGELLYEVSPEQLREDTVRFLKNMAEMNLLQTMTDSSGQELYCIKEGVSGTTSAPFASAQTEISQPTETTASVSAGEDIKLLKRETLAAFIALAAFDLLLKFAGFQSLIRRVERWPTAEPRTTDSETCRRVRAMVDRAQMYYPKKAMCLQHSAVVTWLLRRRGVPAEMVLAACDYPPEGHAWAEVEGEVVNDSQKVKDRYRQLRRV
jgi:hypothetical protein